MYKQRVCVCTKAWWKSSYQPHTTRTSSLLSALRSSSSTRAAPQEARTLLTTGTSADTGWARREPMVSAASWKASSAARAPSVNQLPCPRGQEEALRHISPSFPLLSLLSPHHFVARKKDWEFLPNTHYILVQQCKKEASSPAYWGSEKWPHRDKADRAPCQAQLFWSKAHAGPGPECLGSPFRPEDSTSSGVTYSNYGSCSQRTLSSSRPKQGCQQGDAPHPRVEQNSLHQSSNCVQFTGSGNSRGWENRAYICLFVWQSTLWFRTECKSLQRLRPPCLPCDNSDLSSLPPQCTTLPQSSPTTTLARAEGTAFSLHEEWSSRRWGDIITVFQIREMSRTEAQITKKVLYLSGGKKWN